MNDKTDIKKNIYQNLNFFTGGNMHKCPKCGHNQFLVTSRCIDTETEICEIHDNGELEVIELHSCECQDSERHDEFECRKCFKTFSFKETFK